MSDLVTQPKRLGAIIAYGAIVLLFFGLGLSSLFNPFGTDQGEYATIAAAAQQGKVIYRDIFNVKPPMTHLIHEAALTLFGHSMVSLRIVDLFWQGLTVWFIVLIARDLFRDRATGVLAATIYILWYYSIDYWNTAQTDGFLNLPVAVGVFCYVRYVQQRRVWLLVMSGAALGFAVFFKYPIGIILPMLVVLLGLNRNIPRVHLLALLGGFGAVVVGFVVYLAAQGALGDFLHIQMTYIPLYNQIDTENYSYGVAFFRRFITFWQTDTIVMSPITPMIAYLIMRRTGTLRSYAVLLLWWLAATIHLGIQQKFYYYHGIPLLAPEALLLAYCLHSVYKICSRTTTLRWAAIITGVLAFGWFYVSLGHFARHQLLLDIARKRPSLERVYAVYPQYNRYLPKNVLEVSSYLNERTHSDDTLFIWGIEPTIYFLADRAPASRFIYSFILYERYQSPQYRVELIRDLSNQPPAYIIVPENDAAPSFTGSPSDSLTALNEFTELKQLVDTKYEPEITINTFHLYRRK